MRVGVLTGGGDCPGLNAVIRGAVRAGMTRYGHEFLGLRHGWRGLLECETTPLDLDVVRGLIGKGGTILGSSRTNPYGHEGGARNAADNMAALGLDALIAIGGEDTLGVANRLHHDFGLRTVGVPKTIDNDLSGTDYTFGFWTAVQIAVEAIDRLTTTAESHDRVIVVEVMGRHAGWIALESGLAGGADAILIPELAADPDRVVAYLREREARDQHFAIVVVSEGVTLGDGTVTGATDEFGHASLAAAGVGERLAGYIANATGKEARAVVLGHVQRGGTPTAFDRALATRYGIHAARMVDNGAFGRMAALRGAEITDVPIEEAVGTLKTVPPELFADAEVFFG
jgi:ATP-dependent phosphofructokinase / diphosphate-dependent phosphofructokinase